jgi:hypothetical protein
MSHAKTGVDLWYAWSRGGQKNSVEVAIGESLGVPAENSHGEFIIEHYWGYTKRGAARTDEYKVEHPKWELFAVDDYRIEVDFGAVYGADFAFLSGRKPFSILLAKGSDIAVYKGERIS